MSKLPEEYKFLDLSDYGRSPGSWIASKLQNTPFTPIHVTTMFIIAGLIAIGFMLNGYLITAAFFIILKSIIDAADGELSRLKKHLPMLDVIMTRLQTYSLIFVSC